MKLMIEEAQVVDVEASRLDKGDKYVFPCGCVFPIVKDRPDVHGQHKAIAYDLENVSLKCEATWDLISSGRTRGIFQLESNLGKSWAKKLKPRNMEHLAALVALLRPGCLQVKDELGRNMPEIYSLRKNGVDEVTYTIQAVEPVLRATYGVMTYQEQMMQLARDLAGFDLVEVDKLRKAAGKKDQALMAKIGELFIEKADKLGIITREQAEALFENFRKSGRYLFNKCIAADEKVLRPKGGAKSDYTVEEMYRIRTDLQYAKSTGHEQLRRKWNRLGHYGYGLSMDEHGRIRPNPIKDIQEAGIQPVFKVILADNSAIRVTWNHKFPTSHGEMTLGDIWSATEKPLMYVQGEYEPSDFKKINRFSDLTKEDLRANGAGKSVCGQHGESNIGYTNGSWTLFEKFRQSTPDVCAECGRSDVRIEIHHKDGNRENSEWSNLEKLCSSHHKKRQYALGRTKKGEKGVPSRLIAIKSIVADGVCQTYDITMEAPNHNFVSGSGIVTSNSHAVSYAYNTYWSAHWKTHFPLYFFTSYLFWAKDKQKPLQEIRYLIQDAKSFGIEVTTPRFSELRDHFGTDGVIVTFGLADVKNVGETAVQKMRETAAKHTMINWSWFDWLKLFSGHCGGAQVVRRMCEVGALREYGDVRQRLLAEFDAWNRLNDREQEGIINLGDPLYEEVPVTELVDAEKPVYDKKVLAAYKKLKKQHKDSVKGLEDPPEFSLPHPEPIGFEKVKVEVSMKDKRGDVIYEKTDVVIDPPRPAKNLTEAIANLLERTQGHTKGTKEKPSEVKYFVKGERREKVAGILNLLKNPSSPLIDSVYWIAKVEEENLGIPITASHVQMADRSVVNTSVAEFKNGKDPRGFSHMTLGVEVYEVNDRIVQNGENRGRGMASIVVGDETGMLDNVVVFPDAWEEFGHILKRPGALVALVGKRSYRDESSFIVDKVWTI
jgi:hypothetical protein